MTRLVYQLEKQNEITARDIADPESLADGWVLGAFVSGTICATDVTNMTGQLGHHVSAETPRIIGHECCFRVLESKNSGVHAGDFIVPLGSDWYGFAERECFFPILPSTSDDDYRTLTEITQRGYFDPKDERVKATCIVKQWRSGISLIEPITHVYTALLHVGALNARKMLVLGAGFCGQVAGLLAKTFGVQSVVVVDVNQNRLSFAAAHGCADDGIQPHAMPDLAHSTGGNFADVVFDALPGVTGNLNALAETRNLGAQLLRPGGTWVMYSASEYMQMPSLTFLAKGIEIRGAGYDSRLIGFPKRAAQMKAVLGLIESGLIPVDKFIEETISFHDREAVTRAIPDYGLGNRMKVELINSSARDAEQ